MLNIRSNFSESSKMSASNCNLANEDEVFFVKKERISPSLALTCVVVSIDCWRGWKNVCHCANFQRVEKRKEEGDDDDERWRQMSTDLLTCIAVGFSVTAHISAIIITTRLQNSAIIYK